MPTSRREWVSVTSLLMLLPLWALTHRYTGLARDGELYALQAMSRLEPALAHDLYLQNTSQDQFTLFSPLYAVVIERFGLASGELLLFAVCTVGLLTASWQLSKTLCGVRTAWLATAALIVTIGYYGAYLIFSFSENYLSARSMGEALVVAALLAFCRGWRLAAVVIAGLALLIHPLMALPGVLLLICLWLPLRIASALLLVGSAATLALALTARAGAFRGLPALAPMDAAWLEVVRERSQFLFLAYWNPLDWEIAARPFVCLCLSALVLEGATIRKLCVSAMLVGGAGLLVAWIAGSMGPVPLLLQGQAWRWMWVTAFVSVLLLVPTALVIWRDHRGGPLGATLLILAWVFSDVDSLACACLALLLWLIRSRVTPRSVRWLSWASSALFLVIGAWTMASAWSMVHAPLAATGRESLLLGRIREVFGLGTVCVAYVALGHFLIARYPSRWIPPLLALALLAWTGALLPHSLKQLDAVGTPTEIAEFADWRRAIPPTDNVLVVPTGKSAAFVWFTLQRPSYLSVDQSAGVVFSAATAAEVRRRSQVLLPLVEPDWKILSQITAEARLKAAGIAPPRLPPKPLTADILQSLCRDPALGFVAAREAVGFEPLEHVHPGPWNHWNLYDCRRVRSVVPVT